MEAMAVEDSLEKLQAEVIPLMNDINKLNMRGPENTQAVVTQLKIFCSTACHLEFLIKTLHAKAVLDVHFGIKTLVVLSEVLSLEVHGIVVGLFLVNILSQDFERREEVLKNSPSAFMGTVVFLAQAFRILRVDGKPLSQLAYFHITYQKLLLEMKTEEGLQLSVLMLVQNGTRLLVSLPEESLQMYISGITARLMASRPTDCSRFWLMIAHNLAKRSFVPEPNFLESYRHLLAPTSLHRIQCAITAIDSLPPSILLDFRTYSYLKQSFLHSSSVEESLRKKRRLE